MHTTYTYTYTYAYTLRVEKEVRVVRGECTCVLCCALLPKCVRCLLWGVHEAGSGSLTRQVRVEVPVEVVRQVIVEVPVERIGERIVERIVEVPKIVEACPQPP